MVKKDLYLYYLESLKPQLLIQEQTNIFFGIDWVMVFIYIILVGFGWMNICAASLRKKTSCFRLSTKHGKQSWIILSIPIIIFTLFINGKFYERFGSVFFDLIMSLLGLFVWELKCMDSPGIGSELLTSTFRICCVVHGFVAKLLSDRKYNLELIKNQIKVFIIFFPVLIAVHDAGSAIVYLHFFVLNREGLTLAYIICGAIAVILFILTIYLGFKFSHLSMYLNQFIPILQHIQRQAFFEVSLD